MTILAILKILAFIVILFLFVAAIFALVLVVPILHIGKVRSPKMRQAG